MNNTAVFSVTNNGAADSAAVNVTEAGGTSVAADPMTVTITASAGTVVPATDASTSTNWIQNGSVTLPDGTGTPATTTITVKVSSTHTGSVTITTGGTSANAYNVIGSTSAMTLTPASASSFTGADSPFIATPKDASNNAVPNATVHLVVSQTGTSAAPALQINGATTGSTSSGNTTTVVRDVVADGTGAAAFTVQSNTGGTVTVRAQASNNGTVNPAIQDTSTLTEVGGGATPDANVTALATDPTSINRYDTDPNTDVTVTATGAGGMAVNGATVNYQVTHGVSTVQGPVTCSLTSGTGSDAGQTTCTVDTASFAAGSYTATFWVNNATSGATAGPDAGEPVKTVPVVITAEPTWNSGDVTTPEADLPAGRATTIPFTVTLEDSSGNPVANASIGWDIDYSVGSSDKRVMGTTDSTGTATVNVPVTAVQAADGESVVVTAFVSQSPVLGDGDNVDAATVDFALPAPSLSANDTQAVQGGTVSIPVTIADQFGNAAGSGDVLSYTVTAGRNSGTSGTATVGADGKATVSYSDTGTVGGSDTVQITDVTHAYGTANVTVTYVASLVPATVTWSSQPGGAVTSAVSNTTLHGPYTVQVQNSSGQNLSNQQVTFTVDLGFAGDSSVTGKTGTATYTAATGSTGLATVYVGSTKVGDQTITAAINGLTAKTTNKIAYTVGAAAAVTLTGPSGNIPPGTTANFTVSVVDAYGNPESNESVTLAASGPATLPGGVNPMTINTGATGVATVTVSIPANATGSGAVTATVATSVIASPNNVTSANYTVGTNVSKVKVAGIKGVGTGGTEKVAVRVWNADGSLAGNATVSVKVTGANTASGTATTGANGELGWFSYTAKHAGTDHVTATIDGQTDTTTVTISSAVSSHLFHPVAQANGTFLYSVQTIPATKGARVNLFAVYHPGRSDQALFHAGNSVTNAAGRAARATSPGYLVNGHFKHYRAGATYVLVAKIAGSAGQSNMSSATAK